MTKITKRTEETMLYRANDLWLASYQYGANSIFGTLDECIRFAENYIVAELEHDLMMLEEAEELLGKKHSAKRKVKSNSKLISS